MADSFNLKAIVSLVDKASPGLRKLGEMAQGTKKYLADIGGAAKGVLGKAGLPTGLLSGILAGFSIEKIKEAVHGFAETGESLYVMSKKTGVGVEELQRLQYVAKQTGVDGDALATSMFKLQKNVAEAAAGKNKDLASLFKAMGINMRDANHHIRSSAELLPELADAFKRNEHNPVLARMGVAVFGKSVMELLPMLLKGREGIDEFYKRFAKLKSPMDEKTAEQAEELQQAFNDLDIVTKGFQATIAKGLVPIIRPMIEEFTDWAAANRALIATEIGKFVKELAGFVKSVDWTGLVRGVTTATQAVGGFVQLIGGAKVALALLTAYISLEAIKSVVELGLAFWRAGVAMTVWSATTIPKVIASLAPMTAGLAASAGAAALLVAQLTLLIGVGLAAYNATKWISEKTGFRDWVSDKVAQITGLENEQNSAVRGDGTGNPKNPLPLGGPRAGTQQVGGTIKLDFSGMPQGARITQAEGFGGLNFDTSAGYSSDALKLPY